MNPILIANEAVEEYRAKKKKGWILKLDLEQDFDRVDWEFLEKILMEKKVDTRWITWIMGCISNPKYSIFINGRPRGRIKATRRIQGDPLSPFIFLLISKMLSALLNRLYEKGKFEGSKVGKISIHVHCLQIADDTLIFCKYEKMECWKLLRRQLNSLSGASHRRLIGKICALRFKHRRK